MEPIIDSQDPEIMESNSSSSPEWSGQPATMIISPVDFIDMMDPTEVEEEALGKLQWGDGNYTPTAAILDVIKDRFRALEP